MELNLYKFFGSHTLRFADSGIRIAEMVSDNPDTDVILDFADIDFVSLPFCQMLVGCLKCLKDKNIVYANRNSSVERMMQLAEERNNIFDPVFANSESRLKTERRT